MPTSSVLSVRLNESERALLEAASEGANTSLSDFVRRRAIEAAEIDLLERRIVTIPAEQWEAFEAWVRSPPKANAALKRLTLHTPTWDR